MSKYEIMLILDPNSDEKNISELVNSTFKDKDFKIEKLERTELAYEINKSKTGKYILINVKAHGDEINEFTRKANIAKNIWRMISINLDTEKGLQRKAKPKRFKKPMFGPRRFQQEKTNEKIEGQQGEKPKKEFVNKSFNKKDNQESNLNNQITEKQETSK